MKRAALTVSYFLWLCLCLVRNAGAADIFNSGGLFLNAAFDLYINAGDLSTGIMPGIRGGGGWEFPIGPGNLMLGLETGFFNMKQRSGSPVPATISLSAAYWYHLNNLISLGLGLTGGSLFAPSGNLNVAIPFFGPRLYGEWAFSRWEDGSPFASLYLGGGADFDLEKDNLSIMPLVEAGLRFRFGKPDSNRLFEPAKQTVIDEPNKNEIAPEEAAPPNPEPEEPVSEWDTAPPEPEPPDEPDPYPDLVIETEPIPLPNSGPIRMPSTRQIPRGDRLLVLLPDGRRGFILEECTIYFGPDVTRIQTREEAKLRRAVQLFTQFPASRFVIAGFSAWAGSEEGRDGISWERGRNVTDYLANNGIDTERMELHWYGAAYPAAPNTNIMMSNNRRVEFIVLEE